MFKARSRAGASVSLAEAGGPDPLAVTPPHPISDRGLPRQVQLPCAEDGGREPHPATRAIRFPDEARTPARFILQERKADYSKAMPRDTHPLATEPGAPARFTFLEYRPRDSNPHVPGSEPGASCQLG